MSERLTEPLVCDALHMALIQRGASSSSFHQDSQYNTSHAYLALPENVRIQVSMSGVGRCYDNAMKESFWATLKREYADHTLHTRAFARHAIFEYIEVWYNRQQRHSVLGFLGPCAFEQLFCP
jgi:putative transposase